MVKVKVHPPWSCRARSAGDEDHNLSFPLVGQKTIGFTNIGLASPYEIQFNIFGHQQIGDSAGELFKRTF